MSLTLVVFAGFYAAARHTVQYANTLTQALRGKLVLLHVNRASLFDPYATVPEHYHQEELARQAETAAALYRMAEELSTRPTVEIATDLLPEVAQDQAARHRPALFVLSPPYQPHENAASIATGCADLLRSGHHPLLVVPTAATTEQPPRRILIAADREAFALTPASLALHPLFALPGVELIVAHVSDGEDDAGCGAALRAVQLSGLVKGLATPELRGYEHDNYAEGVLAAVEDTQADLVVVLARQRSYLGELFHRSVTAQLLTRCPVPVLVLPVAVIAAPETPSPRATDAANWTAGALAGLSPAN
ncbi:universal stress protein [Hymenobacter sp.]|uniref:universal stress protein n=1 Tax=Hymenobacter sp. TaxID=1898978 RepID=UPI00286B7D4D|nr:universal stress protein [Hymenobacter sp.]